VDLGPSARWIDYLYEDRLCQGIDGGHSTVRGWIKDRFGDSYLPPSPMPIKAAEEPGGS